MDFYKRVVFVGNKIPYGKVATYGQIALLCGKPGNSRQVGYAVGHQQQGADIPAHRIVNAKGYLSGSKAFAAPDMQERLLEMEGIEVSKDNGVDLNVFGWKHTLKEALNICEQFEELQI